MVLSGLIREYVFASSEDLFNCLLDTLQQCQSSNKRMERLTCWSSWKQFYIFWNHNNSAFFRDILTITDPASNYLQSEKIGLLTAVKLVDDYRNCKVIIYSIDKALIIKKDTNFYIQSHTLWIGTAQSRTILEDCHF